MGDPQCSRVSDNKPDYTTLEKLLRFSVSRSASEGESPLVVFSGDLVNRGGKQEEWDAFFQACDHVRMEYDFTMVSPTGTHGAQADYPDVKGFRDRFLLPGNGPYGHEDGFYSFDYGCAHFIVLDSRYMDNPQREASKYLGAWIKYDLATNRQPAVFAVMHHPMYSTGSSIDDDIRAKAMRENYLKLLYRYGVDFILCGHQHIYCRTGGQADVTQIMGVAGGKRFNIKKAENFETYVGNVAATTLFETDGNTIEMETFDEEGNCIDRYVQSVRPVKPRKCGTCPNFDHCGGTGIVEKTEAEERALAAGHSPLIPAYNGGLMIDGKYYDQKAIDAMDWQEHTISFMKRGKPYPQTVKGVELQGILQIDPEKNGAETIVSVISEDGVQARYQAELPLILFRDEADHNHRSSYRLTAGQPFPRHVIQIEASTIRGEV